MHAMSPDPHNDDPTHALDDFVQRMRSAVAPNAVDTDLADLQAGLQARLHPKPASEAARLKGGRLRNGQRWDADDVVDVPVLDLPRMPPQRSGIPEIQLPSVDLVAEDLQSALAPETSLPKIEQAAPPDDATLNDSTRHASAQAAASWQAETRRQAEPAWQPDPQALQLRRASPARLLTQWQPGVWTGAGREVFESTTEFVKTASGTAVETYPPHRLLLLWPPQRLDAPLLGRWPQQLRLSAVPADQASEDLLKGVPEPDLLWLNSHSADVDWALAAEIVLHHEPALRPFQSAGLRAFIDAEREATFARLNADYQQPAGSAAVLRR